MMLSSAFDMDIIHATSGAVYAIICSQKVQCIYTCRVHIVVRYEGVYIYMYCEI